MRRYVENVPPSLTQKELHDRAYALLYRVLKDEWGIASPVVEKTSARQAVFKRGEHAPYQPEPHEGHRLLRRVAEKWSGIDAEYPRRVRGVPRARLYARELWTYKAAPTRRALSGVLDAQREHLQVPRQPAISESFQNYEITFQNGMPHLNGYTLFFEQYGVHFLAAAEEA